MKPPSFDFDQICKWIASHYDQTGEWPTSKSGPVLDEPSETWSAIDLSLRNGTRGLSKGSSLAKLLSDQFGVRSRKHLPQLTEFQIIEWAKQHYELTGKWPTQRSGVIPNSNGEKWHSIDQALTHGLRGLAGGTSLRKLCEDRFAIPRARNYSTLAVDQILEWANTYRERTGAWPDPKSGIIQGTTGETWGRINSALMEGARGLPKGLSLFKVV